MYILLSKRIQKLAALVVSFLLVSSLFPAGVLFAATGSTPGNWFVFQNGISTDPTNPTYYGQPSINVSAAFTSVNPNSISYTVTSVNVTNGVVTPVSGISPVNSNGQQPTITNQVATFANIPLFPGLNEITFKGTAGISQVTSTNTNSSPIYDAFVYYTNAPYISNVQVPGSWYNTGSPLQSVQNPQIQNGQDVYYSSVNSNATITFNVPASTASNPSTVTVKNTTNNMSVNAMTSGSASSFVANIRLLPGDNNIVITSDNGTQTQSFAFQLTYLQQAQPTHFNIQNILEQNSNALKTILAVPNSFASNQSQLNITVSASIYNANIQSDGSVSTTGGALNSPANLTVTTDNTIPNPSSVGMYYYDVQDPVPSGSSYPSLYSTLQGLTNGQYALQLTTTVTPNGGTSTSYTQNVPFQVTNSSVVSIGSIYSSPSGFSNQPVNQTQEVPVTSSLNATKVPLYLDVNVQNETPVSSAGTNTNQVFLQWSSDGLNWASGNIGNNTGVGNNPNSNLQYTVSQLTSITSSGTSQSDYGITINSMPQGNFYLRVVYGTYNSSSVSILTFSNPIQVTASIAAFIEVDSISNGQQMTQLPSQISGKLLNFGSDAAASTLTVKYNNQVIQSIGPNGTAPTNNTPYIQLGAMTNGVASFTFYTQGLTLSPGQNQFIFTANVNGNSIQTTITVYNFSSQPYWSAFQADPSSGLNVTGNNTFSISPTTGQSNTSLTAAYDATISNISTSTSISIQYTYNGTQQTITIQPNSSVTDQSSLQSLGNWQVSANGGSYTNISSTGITINVGGQAVSIYPWNTGTGTNSSNGQNSLSFQISGLPLNADIQSGNTTTSFTFGALNNAVLTAQMNFTVQYLPAPYNILWPNLIAQSTGSSGLTTGNNAAPQYITNSNFLPIVIQAYGGQTGYNITINKINATQIQTTRGPAYAVELEGLKPGLNTITFTVSSAGSSGKSNTTKGSFTVYYAAQSTIGAQYKTQLPAGGKINALNGLVQLNFPSNTMFQPFNVNNPGQPALNLGGMTRDLNVLFGIADPRTGSIDQVGTPQPQQLPALPGGFFFAGNMYWIDAGQSPAKSPDGFTPAGGVDPVALDYKELGGVEQNMSQSLLTGLADSFPGYSFRTWMQPTNQGTVVLKYDSSILNNLQNKLTVLYLGSGNYAWRNLGGTVNTGAHTITVPFAGFGYYVVMQELSSYPDIENNSVGARDALESMYAKGIMNADTGLPNSFGAYENITRGEFAEMLVKILRLPLNYNRSNPVFTDVPTASNVNPLWDFTYIDTAARAGIIRGIQPGVFNPTGTLSRQDAVTMIERALNAKLPYYDPDTSNPTKTALQKQFTDASSIDPYAAPSVLAAVKSGFILGVPNAVIGNQKQTYSFQPMANLTRWQAAIIATRVMQSLKLLSKTT